MMFYFVSDKFDRDIQEGFLRVMQKNVATKLASNFFKQQQSRYFKQLWEIVICTDNTILSKSFHNLGICVVKYNGDPPCLSAMETVAQCSKSFR